MLYLNSSKDRTNKNGKVIFMVNYIICDDDRKDRDLVERVVTKFMMKNEIEYDKHLFDDYNSSFIAVINKKLPCKIYILDIETPSGSGIDMARIIRNKDVDSVIIFLTAHDELSTVCAKKDFLFLTFINKYDYCEKRLEEALEKALRVFGERNLIRFKDGGVVYTINLNDILYITKDSVERKSIIATDYSEFKISKSLTEIMEMLNCDFIKTHRSCIVNKRRIVKFNKPKKSITFDNGKAIDIVSSGFKGELI